MVISEALLNKIANPTVIDPGEQFRAGTEQSQRIENTDLVNRLTGLQADRIEIKGAREDKNAALKDAISYISSAALSSKNPEKQNEMLSLGYNRIKAANIPEGEALYRAVIETQPGKERDSAIQKVVQIGQQYGLLNQLSAIGAGARAPSKQQKTSAFLVRGEGGVPQIVTGVFDPDSGTLKTAKASIPGAQLISKLGETGQEQTQRKVGQKQQESRVVKQAGRTDDLISRGIAAAEGVPTIKRAIDLLDSVKTGGFNSAALKIKQVFGVEGADEGELSNNMGKAVLSQLRETFGAAFTVEEGKRLERIEAGFGKSPAANKVLLKQTLRIAQRTATRAISAAKESGDQFAVDDINSLLNAGTGEPTDQQAAQPKGKQTYLNFDAQGNLIQ